MHLDTFRIGERVGVFQICKPLLSIVLASKALGEAAGTMWKTSKNSQSEKTKDIAKNFGVFALGGYLAAVVWVSDSFLLYFTTQECAYELIEEHVRE